MNKNNRLATVTAARDAAFVKYAEAQLVYEAALAAWVAEYERAMPAPQASTNR